jgi:nitronate monooxygenase
MSNPPTIIQGGMGVAVSHWRLAQTVSRLGQLGVVSGTALDQVLVRRLQDGDPGGHMRRGLDRFPFPHMAERIWRSYYVSGGKARGAAYKTLPMPVSTSNRELQELWITANFVEVVLAREGHDYPVGINYLEKVQIPHLCSLYGAMLAGVSYVIMGAGIPTKIPGVLDAFVHHEPATYPLHVAGAPEGERTTLRFDPGVFAECALPHLRRPKFLAIVASNTLAATMIKKSNGKVDGLVIEGPTAGGHNAPPRGKLQLNRRGEAIYGERDRVDLAALRELGVPFWLAGGYGTAESLHRALAAGAAGVQVGTAFAFCAESALREDYKRALLRKAAAGDADVFTDPVSSPTGFPFKAAQLEGSLSEYKAYAARPRICDLGFMREAHWTDGGVIEYRCSAEPEAAYLAKGGKLETTVGKKCLCNALLANVGYPQMRCGNRLEQGLITAGDDLTTLARFLPPAGLGYSAADVIATILDEAAPEMPHASGVTVPELCASPCD